MSKFQHSNRALSIRFINNTGANDKTARTDNS